MVEAMEIPKEFKKTEVGVIPNDWDVKQLFQVSLIIDSLHQTPKFSNDGYAMVRVSDIKTGNLNLGNTLRVSEEIYKIFIKNYLPQKGDIVLSRVGSYGVSSFVNTHEPFCMGQNTVVIEPKISNKYLYYILNSSYIKSQIENESFGTGYKSLSLKNIKELQIPLPPTKTEQTAIAEALNDTDALITELEKLIAKKKAIKQGAMQELLKPKADWEVKKLGEIAEFFKGKGLPKSNLVADGSIKCIHYGELFLQYKEDITNINNRTNEFEGAFYSKINDVLMPTSDVTPRGLATASCLKEDGVLLGGDILVIRIPKQIANGSFLSHYIRLNRNEVMKLVKGVTVYHLHASDMKDYCFKYPNIEEQNNTAKVLFDMENEIEKLEELLCKYKMLKQGMMQNLLTGKIRLI